MEQSVTIKARGKVNLSLNILGVRDGMHLLDSVVASVDIYDEVTVAFRRDGAVNVQFEPLAGSAFRPGDVGKDNSVAAALQRVQAFYPEWGADVTVKKGIPLAGGLGGSSADAAAVYAAARLLLPDAEKIDWVHESVRTGSDVPVMLTGGCVRMFGIGDGIRSAASVPLCLAIAKGSGGVSSGAAYGKFDELYPDKTFCPADTDALLRSLAAGDTAGIAARLRNALYEPARLLCPQIAETCEAIRRTDALAVFMTGSGSCCCGLYRSQEEARLAADALRQSGLWATHTVTCSVGCERI